MLSSLFFFFPPAVDDVTARVPRKFQENEAVAPDET